MQSLIVQPEIKIVRHASAKHMRLRVDAHSIRLTVPKFCHDQQIQQFLAQHQQWLARVWAQQQAKLNTQTSPDHFTLFNRQNAEQRFHIQAVSTLKTWQLDVEQQILYVNDQAVTLHFRNFVLAYAKKYLAGYLQQVAQQCAIHYQRCNIRLVKTRWGSCSQRHAIMLNASLVLLPEKLVRYVCVHELAHTRHFDHSPAFWAEVARHDADFQQHRRALKQIQLPHCLYR
ncbi:M48 family metallopeptidase [Acinetobacter larvae]|uniref:YgjP-like metallopeptidase domain-containing protein n=1 Tax=Acinetobacter larvae TaxID=1789224 RepID=A0A1B2M019_9GAMM|nr:SprT family zinc-dependent metalloprotease [Acinetobacter larvae]AOA58525.1 hypothetical protein BFG52_09305 [Acinetobacter larvae]